MLNLLMTHWHIAFGLIVDERTQVSWGWCTWSVVPRGQEVQVVDAVDDVLGLDELFGLVCVQKRVTNGSIHHKMRNF